MNRRSLNELRQEVRKGGPYPARLLCELRDDDRIGARRLHEICRGYNKKQRAEKRRMARMFAFEEQAAEQGFRRIAGVDEAGRGPLAGPIVAGAVILGEPVDGLNDSKQVLPEERDQLYQTLLAGPHKIGVGIIQHEEIDRIGIQAANYAAMAAAVQQIQPQPDYLLVDGFQLPGVSQPQLRLIKGDSRSASIAAASIVAKVTRDRIMIAFDRDYPSYGFAHHKGYCTAQHLEAVATHGPCPIHRRSFAPFARPRQTDLVFDDLQEV